MASVLVRTGTLRIGDYVVAGASWGKVRALFDDRGRRVEAAGPSMPVKLMGLGHVPEPGDILELCPMKQKPGRSSSAALMAQALTLEHLGNPAGETRQYHYQSRFQGSIDAINALQRIAVSEYGSTWFMPQLAPLQKAMSYALPPPSLLK
jgi:translation initiation factor IF-2